MLGFHIQGLRIKKGKKTTRTQMCDVHTDANIIAERNIPVEFNSIQEHGVELAWFIDPKCQYLGDDGVYHQVLTEKSIVPLFAWQGNGGKEIAKEVMAARALAVDARRNEIVNLASRDKIRQAFKKHGQGMQMERLQTIVSFVCGTMLILGTMVWVGGC